MGANIKWGSISNWRWSCVSRTGAQIRGFMSGTIQMKEFTVCRSNNGTASIANENESKVLWGMGHWSLAERFPFGKKDFKIHKPQIKNIGTRVFCRFDGFAPSFFSFSQRCYGLACFRSPCDIQKRNLGYVLIENGYIELKQQYDWKKRAFIRKLHITTTGNFKVNKTHPVLGNVLIKCDFILIPGNLGPNNNTFFV